MRHAIKEKPPGKPKPGRKKIALVAALSALAVAVIAVLVFFNYNHIYGVISPIAARIFPGLNAEKSPESSEVIDDTEMKDEEKTSASYQQINENSGSSPAEEKDDSDKTGTTAEDTMNTNPATDKEENDKEQKENDKKEQNTLPAIKLEVYEGPLYSPEDDTCYYRVRAIVSGNPSPSVSFSKDDSLGSLGKGKAQVNLKRNDGPFTLAATASNIAGKASGSITLSWGCNIAPQIKAINLSSNTLYVSRQYDLKADAVDLDGDAIQCNWSANAGTISQNSSNPARWTCPDAPGEYNITLVVSDNHGNKSAPHTIKLSVKAGQEPISNSTSMVGYQEVSTEQLVGLFVKRNPSKTERAARLAPMYINYGKMFNIRADIAWAQMCHETGFLEYTGDVKPGQNNFAGIGATGGGEPGNSFATEELGIIAQYAHLAWYYFPDHVNKYCSLEYDPRHFENIHKYYTGDTRLGYLNGRWAPGATYTDKIALFANEIYGN